MIALILARALSAAGLPPPSRPAELHDGSHDFDFETGVWRARIQRRLKPLAGSDEWAVYEGSSTVRPVWGGKANLGELDVAGPAGHIRGLSLRLYNPQTRQWSIRWANARDGELGPPMIGSFDGGAGLFYDQEDFGDRAVLVRFIFSGVSARSFRIEQAFSADGGRTWETNWISDFTR
jgi:hypothetical protein